jgi:hypothetical protein
MQTATEQMRRQDLRMMRSQQLVAAVLHKLGPLLDDRQDYVRRDAYEALLELFHNEGVDVITDAQRADAGLPPRGPDGYTMEEMVAIEKRRLDMLNAPLIATLNGEPVTFRPAVLGL